MWDYPSATSSAQPIYFRYVQSTLSCLQYTAFGPQELSVTEKVEDKTERTKALRMLEPDFISMLRCVESGSELSLLDSGELDGLNEAITQGKVTTQVGHQLERPLEAALINADGSWVYQVLDGIPVLLAEQAIAYQQFLEGANS